MKGWFSKLIISKSKLWVVLGILFVVIVFVGFVMVLKNVVMVD